MSLSGPPAEVADAGVPELPPPAATSPARTTLQVVGVVLAVAAVLWMAYSLRLVLLLLVLSVFVAYLIEPLARGLGRPFRLSGRTFALPLPAAIGAVYLLIGAALAGVVLMVLPFVSLEVADLTREAPGYLGRLEDRWLRAQARYHVQILPGEVREAVDRGARAGVAAAEEKIARDLLPKLGELLVHLPLLMLVPALTFFLVRDARLLRHMFLRMLPRGPIRARGVVFVGELHETLAGYIRAQVTASLVVGIVCTIAFQLMGVPYAMLLGILAGLLEIVPLAGPLAIAVLAIGAAAFHSLPLALGVALFLAVLRVVQDSVVFPRIVGRGTHVHPFAVILAILCGVAMAGLAGAVLAIPAVAIATLLWRHYREHLADASEPI